MAKCHSQSVDGVFTIFSFNTEIRNSMKRIFWCFLSGMSFLITAHAASFDCEKANTKIEKLICSDASLSKFNDDLNAAYRSALHDAQQATAIRRDQLQWMKNRNNCSEIICIKNAYTTRIANKRRYRIWQRSCDGTYPWQKLPDGQIRRDAKRMARHHGQ
jgi:uncharacterized protein YecT (DUF1311 family)